MANNEVFDVTIIGGGPAGLYAAFYSGLREMRTKIVEYQSQLGGKLHVYPEKMIWDVGGQPPIPAAKLIEQLVEQGLTFDPEVVLNEKVESISRSEEGLFKMSGTSGETHLSKTVIIAAGGGILLPQKLDIEGADRFEVANLHYTVKSMSRFKDKTVIISGGGNTAIDWANELSLIAKNVHLTHRKSEFSGHESQSSLLNRNGVSCFLHTTITKLVADVGNQSIERVELTNHQTGEITYLPIDEVIINHGYERDASLIENSSLHIETANDFYIKINSLGRSSVEGLYAAGDIVAYNGKIHLIAGAFQDAVNAVNQAKQYIHPAAGETAMVSSHNDIFKERNRELIKELVR